MCGDKRAGYSVFWADDGLDTGPILLQKECSVDPDDTVDTLYNKFMYPEGIKSMVRMGHWVWALKSCRLHDRIVCMCALPLNWVGRTGKMVLF